MVVIVLSRLICSGRIGSLLCRRCTLDTTQRRAGLLSIDPWRKASVYVHGGDVERRTRSELWIVIGRAREEELESFGAKGRPWLGRGRKG
jgi:hypothetical protein